MGLLLGAILAGTDWLLQRAEVSSLLSAAILVVLLLALSGALHADGLLDTCDAVFCHATPDRRLEIMRDPHVGAFGVVGFVCVVALKLAALAALPGATRGGALLLAPTLGRWAIVVVAAAFPYGRPSGLGGSLKVGATPLAVAVATLCTLVVCGLGGVTGLASGALAFVVALALGRWLLTLLPGLTGDTYGAICEVVETVVWLSAAPLARLAG